MVASRLRRLQEQLLESEAYVHHVLVQRFMLLLDCKRELNELFQRRLQHIDLVELQERETLLRAHINNDCWNNHPLLWSGCLRRRVEELRKRRKVYTDAHQRPRRIQRDASRL